MIWLILAVAATLQDPAATDASKMTLSIAEPIADLDMGKMKGDPARLAWSPDKAEFYVQTVERDSRGAVKSAKHYVVSIASRTVKNVDREPEWASAYWAWKSAQASPGAAAFKIAVDGPRQETVRATSAPAGGALAKGGTANPLEGTTVADVAAAVDQSQTRTIYTLKVNGESLGDWVNEPVTPGSNFSWAPAPIAMIVFTKRAGGPLVVIDAAGRRQQLAGAKMAMLPAWSNDGTRIAWLERKDKKKYDLVAADVAAK
jgi:hypothetical protein